MYVHGGVVGKDECESMRDQGGSKLAEWLGEGRHNQILRRCRGVEMTRVKSIV